jgi:hypothetical protein
MGAVAASRAELVTSLDGLDAKVTDHVPERLSLPAAMIVHGSPLLEAGDTFGSKLVRFEVWVISRLAANARMTEDLDILIEATVEAVAFDGWTIERVEQPFAYNANGASYLASTISVSTHINL